MKKNLTSSYLCKEFKTTFYFRLGDLLASSTEKLRYPWFEWASVTIHANESMKNWFTRQDLSLSAVLTKLLGATAA